MADLTPARTVIPFAGTQFLNAVSENMIQSIAGTNNWVFYFDTFKKDFFINGNYSIVTAPQYGVDGLAIFEFDTYIVDAWMFSMSAGSSGTTELDIKVANSPAGSFNSIFSTTPKITSAASHPTWVGAVDPTRVGSLYSPGTYIPPANTTRPILNPTYANLIPAWGAAKIDILQSMPGGENCGLILICRVLGNGV